MAKTIKFNLILDGCPVRTIDGLREHFSIEDMLEYYKNGLLLRWLNVRGYTSEFEQVKKINKNSDNKAALKELIEIFEITDIDNNMIDEEISILDYIEKKRKQNDEYMHHAENKKKIISDYHEGYKTLINHMIDNKDNIAVLKADAVQMAGEYLGLFALDSDVVYSKLCNAAPKAIYAMLMIDELSKYWMDKNKNEHMYSQIRINFLSPVNAKEFLGKDLKILKRNTSGKWDLIEKSNTKIMVIHMGINTFIKNKGNLDEKLGADDVNGKLIKLNGLEYQSFDSSKELLYMEV